MFSESLWLFYFVVPKELLSSPLKNSKGEIDDSEVFLENFKF